MSAKLQALVIDDEPDITRLIAEVLRQEGWDVTEAASAEEASKVLPTKTWGAVFSDVVLDGDDDDLVCFVALNKRCPPRQF
jgi:two-component system NtrC family response regulator